MGSLRCRIRGDNGVVFEDDKRTQGHPHSFSRWPQTRISETFAVGLFKVTPGDKFGHLHPAIIAAQFTAEGQMEVCELQLALIVSVHENSRKSAKIFARMRGFAAHFFAIL